MKRMLFALVLSTAVLTSSICRAQNHPQEQSQADMSVLFEQVNERFMPEFEKIYKKYFEDIKWALNHCIKDSKKAEQLWRKLFLELEDSFKAKFDKIIDPILKEAGLVPSREEKKMLKDMLVQVMPITMVESIKRNAEMHSAIYHELYGANAK